MGEYFQGWNYGNLQPPPHEITGNLVIHIGGNPHVNGVCIWGDGDGQTEVTYRNTEQPQGVGVGNPLGISEKYPE